MGSRKHHRQNTGGLSKRDRGRRTERPHLQPPREVSVERVDDFTIILRTPEGLPDEGLESLVLHTRDLCRVMGHEPPSGTHLDVTAGGVWLSPDEVLAMEEDQPFPELDDDKSERRWEHP